MARTFAIKRQPGFATDRDHLLRAALHRRSVTLVVYAFNEGNSVADLEGLLAALVPRGVEQRARSSTLPSARCVSPPSPR
jgi:hypothetical protein